MQAAAAPASLDLPKPARIDLSPRRMSRPEELERQVARLAERMRVAVIHGGDKSAADAVIHPTFNPRHWKSYERVAEDIAAALRRLGFRHVTTMPDDMRLGDRLRREGVDLAWLNTGGVQGFGAMSHTAAMLEMFGVPYVGHDPVTTGILDNKHLFKRELVALGLPTARFMIWHLARGPLLPDETPRFRQAFGDYRGPFIVKPVSGRASQHVRVVDEAGELTQAVAEVYAATENHVLIETYLPGREFCVAVCGRVVARGGKLGRGNEPFTFSAVERAFETGERIFTSMDQRPITNDRVRMLSDEGDALLRHRLHELARQLFVELDLETLIRLDVRAGADGRLYLLEANPKPDLAAPAAGGKTSLVCHGLAQHDMSYDDLILSLIADRIDILFAQRRGTVGHLSALLG